MTWSFLCLCDKNFTLSPNKHRSSEESSPKFLFPKNSNGTTGEKTWAIPREYQGSAEKSVLVSYTVKYGREVHSSHLFYFSTFQLFLLVDYFGIISTQTFSIGVKNYEVFPKYVPSSPGCSSIGVSDASLWCFKKSRLTGVLQGQSPANKSGTLSWGKNTKHIFHYTHIFHVEVICSSLFM